MIRLPLRNLNRVQKELEKIVKDLKPFPVTSYRYKYIAKVWVAIMYYRNIHLRKLQKKVIDAINPLREGILREEDRKEMNTFPLRYKRMLEKYGFLRVLKEYHPHITLTKLPNQLALPRMGTKLKWEDHSFTVNKLAIYISGEHSTCRKLIKSFNIPSE